MLETTNAIQKACRIISCFSFEQSTLSLVDFCEQTGFAKSTIHRICATLIEEGFLCKTDSGSRYALTPKMFELGTAAIDSLDIKDVCRDPMNNLAQTIGETVALYIGLNDERICIDMAESPAEVRIMIPVGHPLPLYLGASGQVLLGWMSQQKRNCYYNHLRANPPDRLRKTVDQLADEVAKVHQQGYALTFGERVPDTVSIAAPLFYKKNQVAAIALAAPTYRMDESKLEQSIQAVKNTAETINQRLL